MKPTMELTRDALIGALAGLMRPDVFGAGADRTADPTESKGCERREPAARGEGRQDHG